MNGAATSATDAAASGAGGGGSGGVADSPREVALPAAAANDCLTESAAAEAENEVDLPAAGTTIPRVDSLTLALEAIQSKQAAAAFHLSAGVDSGCSKAVAESTAVASAEDDSIAAATTTTFLRVDSLTLALEAFQSKQAAVVGRRSRKSDGGGSSGGEDSGSGCGEENARPSSKRASSLKLVNRQASCPEGQQAKKVVRFADAMGLDLALVRHVFDLDSPPEIPPQATRDLVLPPSDDEFNGDDDDEVRDKDRSGAVQQQQQEQQHLFLSPSFAQPGSAPNFNSRITAQKVVLEKAYYHSATPAASPGHVRGLVRVANLGFEKSVHVRATFDGWRSSVEVGADYQPGGSGGDSDQFAFSVGLPGGLKVGDRVAFCVVYSVNGQTYWDNNFGDNYSFHCVAINASQSRDQVWTRYI